MKLIPLSPAAPVDDVAAASKKLGAATNYAWTVTTEFKDVGTTRVVVPEEAKKKLGE